MLECIAHRRRVHRPRSLRAGSTQRMEADLSTLGLKDLKRHARALGAAAGVIEDLDDAADPKAASIDLIVQLTPAAAPRRNNQAAIKRT
jgi:hypothetical protein